MRKKHLIKLTATHNKKKKENSKRIGIEGIFPDLTKHMYRTANGAPMVKDRASPTTGNEAEVCSPHAL